MYDKFALNVSRREAKWTSYNSRAKEYVQADKLKIIIIMPDSDQTILKILIRGPKKMGIRRSNNTTAGGAQ